MEPIVAGLDPETFAPYICNMDLIGGVAVAESEFNGSVYFILILQAVSPSPWISSRAAPARSS